MHQIREGWANNLSCDQIRIYADPKFSYKQMCQIRLGFRNGLTEEQVQQYAYAHIDSSEMESMRKYLENGVQNIKAYNDAIARYNELPTEQSILLAKAASNGISLAKLDVIANGHFSTEQTEFLLKNMQEGVNTSYTSKKQNKVTQRDYPSIDIKIDRKGQLNL